MALAITDIRRHLGEAYHIHYLPETTSTNDVALQLAREGAPGGTLVCCEYQRAGRGRRGARWCAPAESSVLCSLLLRPEKPLPTAHLAILSGVGAANALKGLQYPVKVKWPNDLLLHDRKVAGILVETLPDAVVIGVGVNCTVPEEAFPEDIRARAGSLHTLCAALPVHREQVLGALAQGLSDAFARVTAGSIIKVLYEWNTMNWFARRKVRVSGPFGVVEGDGLFLDGRKLVFHVFKDAGTIAMPLSSTVEAR